MALLVSLLGAPLPDRADAQMLEEDIKAAYVFKFLHFVEWPAEARERSAGRIALCVRAGPELRKALERLDQRGVGVETVEVRPLDDVRAPERCRVLVVDAAHERGAAALLERASAAGVLTVGESEAFAAAGGIIRFALVGDSVRFDIDRAAARRAGLTISSRLLRVARKVHGASTATPGSD